MTSPALNPSASRPAAQPSTISSSSCHVVCFQMPLLFSRIATRSGKAAAFCASTRINVLSVSKFHTMADLGGGMRAPDVSLDHAGVGDDVGRHARADHGTIAQRQHAIANAGD